MFAFFMMFDPLWILLTTPALIFSIWAQYKVKSTFNKYSEVGVASGMTGAQAAAAVCRESGLTGITIERHQGFLSDHYDPRSKTLRLSPEVHDGRSISAVAVAAHEAGHSMQDADGYFPLVLRSQLVPLTQIGSSIWIIPFLAGAFFNISGLMWLGILFFASVVVFQLVTLPTEFNASNRAKAVLASSGIVSNQQEAVGVSKVLDAAAMTYVAALVASLMQLLYMVLRTRD